MVKTYESRFLPSPNLDKVLNKEQLAMVAAKTKKPNQRIVGGVILWTNQLEADPINPYI